MIILFSKLPFFLLIPSLGSQRLDVANTQTLPCLQLLCSTLFSSLDFFADKLTLHWHCSSRIPIVSSFTPFSLTFRKFSNPSHRTAERWNEKEYHKGNLVQHSAPRQENLYLLSKLACPVCLPGF